MQRIFTIVAGVCAVLIPFSAYAQQGVQGGEVQLTEPSVPQDTAVTVSGRDWYGELRLAAKKCHDGFDIRVDLSSGVGARTLGDPAESGMKLSVPLYSRREQQKQKQNRGVWLEHGAAILSELRAGQGKIRVKREQAAVLKSVLLQGGLSGIEAHFRIREEIVALEAQIEGAEMKLSGLIESCVSGKKGYVAGR